MATAIVFGPTGNIGSVAARAAQENGAKVWLAMRDTTKSIQGLSEEDEKKGGFQRVTADMTKPETLAEAVKKSGATRAYTYLTWGTSDHMKGSFQTLKDSGIEFLVFLSSSSVQGDPKAIPPSEFIPFFHAQAELSLDDVFGSNYVAIRPGRFASNLLWDKADINAGEVKQFGGDFKMDFITPTDMGRVSGAILAAGAAKDGQKKVYLYGPQITTGAGGIKTVAKVLGKDVKITEISAEEGRQQSISRGTPPPVADYLISKMEEGPSKEKELVEGDELYTTGVKNIELYTGKKPMSLEEWVGANKHLFAA
ncbi:uncharacterized protein LTR77_007600 [Saxophila tyrrhenica]|uniref:NmrA-like domain-containing protein n=1 Tax=Saxophila tyrrhenica TaxID=1690608 RepID=A0AAV9P2I6_9PEZI|nr:hypothetical protein LTR77_007600 [Saxophila tyrrhenica]